MSVAHPLPRAGSPAALRESETTLAAHDWRELDDPAFIARWHALALQAAEPNPFYEPWCLLPALRTLDQRGHVRLLVLKANGAPVGLMPVATSALYYGYPLPHWRGWVHDNCFLGVPLVAYGYERAFWRAALDWIDDAAATPVFWHLRQMPLSGPLHDALAIELGSCTAATVTQEERAFLKSDASAADYFKASLSHKKRKELGRQMRRLADQGDLSVLRRTDAESAGRWAREFLDLEARGWKGDAGSALASDGHLSQLFATVLTEGSAAGRVERLSLMLDGRPVAMLANFLTAPGAFSWKTAFDESFARFSPGVLLQRENLAVLDNPDIAWMDSCASENHPMIDHLWRERRAIGCHSIAIGAPARRALFDRLLKRELRGRPPRIGAAA